MNLKKADFKGEKTFLFYVCFLISALIIHLFVPLDWADDAVFYEKTLRLSLSEFLTNSARPLVDMFTYFFIKYPLVWRFLNPFMLVISSQLISAYLPECRNNTVKNICICVAMLYPSMAVVDAGFVATTLNYLWAVTFGMLCFVPIWKKLHHKKISLVEMIFLIPCLLYATNMQQMAIVLVVISGVSAVYLAFQKRFSVYVCIQFLISVLCLGYSYLINTVGENPRMLREIGRYFPDFGELSLFEKVELGFSSTFYCLTLKPSFAWFGFIAFLSVLAFCVYRNSKSISGKVAVVFPFLVSVWGIVTNIFPQAFPTLVSYFPGKLQHYKMKKAVYNFEIIPDIIFVLVVLCVIYSLFVLIKDKKLFIVSSAVFFIGLGTRMVMGFSPTVWASGYRTFYLMFVSMIIVSFFAINESFKSDKDKIGNK